MDISVIIAVYNGEKYIEECLDSIKLCPLANMECIIVNDGSKDNTENICEKYVKNDSRFTLVNRENSGVSHTRNVAIKKASGKYIFIIDADDYLARDSWDLITPYIFLEDNYDMVAFSYYTLFGSGKIQGEPFTLFQDENKVLNITKEILLSTPQLNTCWGKLLKRSIIEENSIEFDKRLKTGEDAVFIIDFMKHITKDVILINKAILYYRQHSQSAKQLVDIDRKLNDLNTLFRYRKDYCKTYGNILIERKMYNNFFSVLTNLFLTYTDNKNFMEIRKKYIILLHSVLIKRIINRVDVKELKPFYKKIEYLFFKKRLVTMLSIYFKMKNRLK